MRVRKATAMLMAGAMTLSTGAISVINAVPAMADDEDDLLSDIIPDKTVTLDVYDQLANYSGEQIGWFAKVMLDKFNVKLNIIPDSDGTYDTRMESGNLGDIIVWGDTGSDYLQAIDKDMLYDWEEDDLATDYAPDILKNMPYAVQKNKQISGGKLYGIGYDIGLTPTDKSSFIYDWEMRYDLYKQIGSPEIKDLNDLEDALEAMQKACPTDDNGNPTYAMSIFKDWDGNQVMYVKGLAQAFYGMDEFGFGLYDPKTQTYHDTLEENGPYLTCLKFNNDLYRKGLLDPDSQTQGYDGTVQDIQNGSAFFPVFNFLGANLYNNDAHLADGKAMYPVKPTEATPVDFGLNIYGSNRVWSVGADTEYPELCIAIINWLATPEGFLTSQYGPQGDCWDYNDDGDTYLTDLGLACKSDINTQMGGDYDGTFKDGSFQLNNTTWALDATNLDSASGETYNYLNWKSYADSTEKPDIRRDWEKWSGAESFDDYLWNGDYSFVYGTTYSESPKSDELSVEWSQVAKCICDNSWAAIYAESEDDFNKTVAQMTQQAKEYGYDDCVKFQKNEAELRKQAEDSVKALEGGEASTEAGTEAE